MENILLFRWLVRSLDRLCAFHFVVRLFCIGGMLAAFIARDANESSKGQLDFERQVFLRQLDEADRQADHKRQLELIEAMKPRRDLTLPAEVDEGY